uniref:Sugar phosphate transporter domain-containing protein n=1 Tax=Lotharella oceanica TaxID=641309 RepID=A0A7S2U136_9EUKA|mmetsp:Transcript_5417/g.10781  ORF Transcript_5417/g.10781 Transcript_5417/m.10781 type:complete len:318 (+) Transcript_5417:66-1019(+)
MKTTTKPSTAKTGVAVACMGYMLCSSLMLIANKLAVTFFAAPGIVLILQLGLTAVCVKGAGLAGLILVDDLEWAKVKPYTLVAVAFLSTIYTNIKTLQYANVETFIVFRASTPILVSVADWWFLGRELPSFRSSMCLLGLLLGACGYVLFDKNFEVNGYIWVMVWYSVFCFDQVYLKHAADTVKMQSNWGKVYYSNLLACIPLALIAVWNQEEQILKDSPSLAAFLAVGLSCVLGVAMSYFAWLARSLISATYFTVVGNSCKIITIVINRVIWDKHASNVGLVCLLLCLLCAYYYKQAPKRADVTAREQAQKPKVPV